MCLRRWIPLVAATCALLPAPRAAAQNAAPTLGGTVVTRRGQPIEQASVTIFGIPGASTTDARGTFRFTAIPAGHYMLAVRRIGFAPAVFTLTMGTQPTDTLKLQLDEAVYRLPDVDVADGRYAGLPERYRDLGRRLDHGQSTMIAADDLARMPSVTWALGRLLPARFAREYLLGHGCSRVSINGYPPRQAAAQLPPPQPSPLLTTAVFGNGTPATVFGENGLLFGGPSTSTDWSLYPAPSSDPANSIPTNMLSAIEFVPPEHAPAAFPGTAAPCGVVVLWT